MKVSLLLFAAAVICSSILKADLIYTNFGPAQSFTANSGLTPGYSAVASPFTPQASFTVDQFNFAAFRSGPATLDSVTFSLYGDVSGLPGISLESFTLTGLGYPAGQDYPASTPLPGLLTANSTIHPLVVSGQQYWIVMSGVYTGDVIWNADGNGAQGAATVVAPDPDSDSPARWILLPNYTQGAFDVEGTLAPAPEPGTILTLGGGLFYLLSARKRRREGVSAGSTCRGPGKTRLSASTTTGDITR